MVPVKSDVILRLLAFPMLIDQVQVQLVFFEYCVGGIPANAQHTLFTKELSRLL